MYCLPGFRTTRREQPTETVLVPGVIHGKFEKVAKLLVNLAVFRLAEVGNLAARRTHCIIRHNQRQSCYFTSVFFFSAMKKNFFDEKQLDHLHSTVVLQSNVLYLG